MMKQKTREQKIREYREYGKTLERASRQVGKSIVVMWQMLNWIQFADCPEKFKPLKFTMQEVSI